MGEKRDITESVVFKTWARLDCSYKFRRFFGEDVSLDTHHMKCLKDSFKSSIWSLQLKGKKQTYPIILKVFKPLQIKRTESIVEMNMYRKAGKFLDDFMPKIYIQSKVNGNENWVFMEYIRQLQGQVIFTPKHFDYIIPTLAKLHAHTRKKWFIQHKGTFDDWLPCYKSPVLRRERRRINERTKKYLDAAMNRSDLKKILKPSYVLLHKLLEKGPNYFPEIIEAGQSIVHSDLSTQNINCNNVNKNYNWQVKFIDWEGAKFAPCWFDMVSLVGVFLAYRTDWRKNEEAIISHCAGLYAKEMRKQGVKFKTDPVKLYKMAQLQRILEKSLYLQLSWEVEGRKKGVLLEGYVNKINVWGKELGLL